MPSRPVLLLFLLWLTIGFVLLPVGSGAQSPSQTPPADDDALLHTHTIPQLGTAIKKLKPIPTGPGILVCEPVALHIKPENADFGSGCARWLQWTVGGQGAFSKTPTFAEVGRIPQQFGKADMRLALPQAASLATMLGVTHVALGTIQSQGARLTLSYQLWEVPAKRAVGAPISLTGSSEQILQRLPGMASALAKRLGVSSPVIPNGVHANSEEMRLLGRLPLAPDAIFTDAQISQLSALAAHEPLAGLVLYCDIVMLESGTIQTVAKALLPQAPANTMIFSRIGWLRAEVLQDYQAQLARNLQRYPNNYLLNFANVYALRLKEDRYSERKAAERLVCLSPNSPMAWLELNQAIHNQARDVRYARMWEDMSSAEQEYVNRAYAQALAACQKAIQLDPKDPAAWEDTAVAAVFSGAGDKIADKAFDTALGLAPRYSRTYVWGLEMYQSKWRNNGAAKLKQLAYRAAQTIFPTEGDTLSIIDELRSSGFPNLSRQVLADFLERQQEAIKNDPKDPVAQEGVALALNRQGKTEESLKSYRRLIELRPTSARAHYDIGVVYEQKNAIPESIQEFQTALQLDPWQADAALQLGNQYYRQQKWEQALAAYQTAARLSPRNEAVYEQLSLVYVELKQYAEAIQIGKQAVHLGRAHARAHGTLGYAYLLNKQYEESVEQFREAVHLSPDYEWAKQKLQEALSK